MDQNVRRRQEPEVLTEEVVKEGKVERQNSDLFRH